MILWKYIQAHSKRNQENALAVNCYFMNIIFMHECIIKQKHVISYNSKAFKIKTSIKMSIIKIYDDSYFRHAVYLIFMLPPFEKCVSVLV